MSKPPGPRIALRHSTTYRYDRPVSLSPHEVRLRPAPHSRTPILSYSLSVVPSTHFINWQQDPYGNHVARLVFTEATRELSFTVDLAADMTAINPFDFFIEVDAALFPFRYSEPLQVDLMAYTRPEPAGPLLTGWIEGLRGEMLAQPVPTTQFLVALSERLAADIRYLVRMEPGVQSAEETLALGCGSCRDSTWLLIQVLRQLGLGARFVSGYLVQLKPFAARGEGPGEPESDSADLHAWAEVYIPGAGWIGLDPTSGLLTGEGHLPLAATAHYRSAAPVSGVASYAETTFDFHMSVARVHEVPRITLPFSDESWQALDALGEQVEADLKAQDVRLTMGGEPTFVSVDDQIGEEWNIDAVGPTKRQRADTLIRRLRERFAPGGMLL